MARSSNWGQRGVRAFEAIIFTLTNFAAFIASLAPSIIHKEASFTFFDTSIAKPDISLSTFLAVENGVLTSLARRIARNAGTTSGYGPWRAIRFTFSMMTVVSI